MEKTDKYIPKDTDKWLKKIFDYYINDAGKDDPRDFNNINENYNLLTGELDLSYLNKVMNPMELERTDLDLATDDEIIPIILPSVNTLIGEIYDRNIDFRAYVVNPDAVSKKEEWVKTEFNKKLDSLMKNANLSDEELKLELTKLNQWKQYDSQDIRERFANHVLRDHIERLKFQRITKEGWKDVIANSQEMYSFDIIRGNVIFERVHPTEIKLYGLPLTGEVHKCEAILHERYLTISEILEKFNLTNAELKKLVKSEGEATLGNSAVLAFSKEVVENEDGTLKYDEISNEFFTDNDMKGRNGDKIMVSTLYFKALRKVGNLHFINEINGKEETKLVSSDYKAVEELGEWIEWEHIPEYWQVTKLLEDIYVDGKACLVQMRDMNNPKIAMAPIVGKVLTIGRRVAKSVVDYLKPIQYQWTVFSKKVSLLWSRNFGKLVRIDISKIPKKYGFDLNLFMSWVTTFGIIIEDPYNESTRNQIIPQTQSSVQSIDMELSSSINQALQYMIYLKELADEMVGVTRQRKGELLASDGLGTTQESIARSLKITEEIFQEHHDMQKILLRYILEYVKKALIMGENKKLQYITDDMMYNIYSVSPELFQDVDYGIMINNSRKQFELEKVFLQLAHAYAQNGAIKMSEIMELYNSTSMSDRVNKLRLREQEQELKMQQMDKAKQEHDKMMQEQLSQLRQQEMEHEIKLQQMKNDTAIQVALINAENNLTKSAMDGELKNKEIDVNQQTETQKALLAYKQKKQQETKK